MNQPVEGVDARTDRVAQGAVGVALLAAFVFRVPWVVPVVGVVLAIGALAGPRANGLHRVFERWIAPRLRARRDAEPEAAVSVLTVRMQDALGAVVLAVASVAYLIGIGPFGWVLTLAEAFIAIVAATTGVHLAERLLRL